MNQLWATIIADFKTGVIDFDTFILKLWATVEADAKGLGGLIKNLVSTDANTLVTDFGPDIQQAVTNIQNTTPGLSVATFIPAFIAAVGPIAIQEGLKILDEDWTIISSYFAANNKIGITPANNGNVGT